MQKAEADGNTTRHWQLITAAVEAAFIDTLELEGKAADKMRGRSTVNIKADGGKNKMPKATKQDAKELRWYQGANWHDAQANRLTHVARRMTKVGRNRSNHRGELYEAQNADTIIAYRKQAKQITMQLERNEGEEGFEEFAGFAGFKGFGVSGF